VQSTRTDTLVVCSTPGQHIIRLFKDPEYDAYFDYIDNANPLSPQQPIKIPDRRNVRFSQEVLLTLNTSNGTPSPTNLPNKLPSRTQTYLLDTRNMDITKSDKCLLITNSRNCITTLMEGW